MDEMQPNDDEYAKRIRKVRKAENWYVSISIAVFVAFLALLAWALNSR